MLRIEAVLDDDIPAAQANNLQAVFDRAMARAGERLGNYRIIRAPSGQGEIGLNIDEWKGRLDISSRRPWLAQPYQSQSFTLDSPILEHELAAWLASLVLERQLAGQALPKGLELLEYLDSQTMQESTGVSYFAGIQSMRISTDGRLVASGMNNVQFFDRELRILDVRGTLDFEGGSPVYFSGRGRISPAGTIMVSAANQTEWFRIGEANVPLKRYPVPSAQSVLAAAFGDGSALFVDAAAGKAWRWRDSAVLLDLPGLFAPGVRAQNISISIDENDGLWIYQQETGRVLHYDALNRLQDVVQLVHPDAPNLYFDPESFTVLDSGAMLLCTMDGHVRGFRRDGSSLFSYRLDVPFRGPPGSGFYALAWDNQAGVLYCSSQSTSGTLFKLAMDQSLLVKGETRDMDKAQGFASLWRDLPATGAVKEEAVAPFLERLMLRARLHEHADNPALAWEAWRDCANFAPKDPAAREGLRQASLRLNLARVQIQESRARETIRLFGTYSASVGIHTTMQLYESLIAAQPENRELRQAMREFAEFTRSMDILNQNSPTVELESKEIDSVFPAMIEAYRTRALGRIRVRNTGTVAVENLRASFRVLRFMDFPSEGPVIPRLEPGTSVELELRSAFNADILGLQEDMQVNSEIAILYKQGRNDGRTVFYTPLTIHRRSALVWDDTARLASFITPHEEQIAAFALRVLAGRRAYSQTGLGEKVQQAMAIVDALGVLGPSYVQDPVSPISQILGKASAIDTVRFPRQTLALLSGDCDDTTALLASLLESVNVETAIVTSPGHVFLAFNTTEPAGRAWHYTSGKYRPMIVDKQVWLPVETTVMAKGFGECVRQAMALLERHDPAEIDVVTLKSCRERYPPVPLAAAGDSVREPDAKAVLQAVSLSMSNLADYFYTSNLALYRQASSQGSPEQAVRNWNRVGILHATYGKLDTAQAWFEEGITRYPDAISLYSNLAGLLEYRNRLEDARLVLARGLSRNKGAVDLNAAMARVLAGLNQRGEGLVYYRSARSGEPALVADVRSYYEGGGDTAGNRATAAGNRGLRLGGD